jgi:hypothetical protein
MSKKRTFTYTYPVCWFFIDARVLSANSGSVQSNTRRDDTEQTVDKKIDDKHSLNWECYNNAIYSNHLNKIKTAYTWRKKTVNTKW